MQVIASSVGKHYNEKTLYCPKDVDNQFPVIKKCKSNFDCFVLEMLLIGELRHL